MSCFGCRWILDATAIHEQSRTRLVRLCFAKDYDWLFLKFRTLRALLPARFAAGATWRATFAAWRTTFTASAGSYSAGTALRTAFTPKTWGCTGSAWLATLRARSSRTRTGTALAAGTLWSELFFGNFSVAVLVEFFE